MDGEMVDRAGGRWARFTIHPWQDTSADPVLVEAPLLEHRVVRTIEATRGAYVVHRGKLHRVPEGFNVVAPSDVWGLARSPILSWRGSDPTQKQILALFGAQRFIPANAAAYSHIEQVGRQIGKIR